MKINHSYQPVRYFFWTLLITWAATFTAAYFSHHEELADKQFFLYLIALLTPFGVALAMIYGSRNRTLIKDFWNRIINLKRIRLRYLPALLLIIPLATLAATAISLLFGLPATQFKLSPDFAAGGGELLTMLIILFLAPTFEELGWRGYGMDSLVAKGRNLMASTLLFAVLWNLWHLPLFFIKGYYHYELLQTNVLFALNFVVSLFPAVLLMNWLFYKNNRSITAIILFHFLLNLFSSLFQTEPYTKCILTVVLLIISVVIVWRDWEFFFKKIDDE